MYPRSFLGEEAIIKQRTPLKKELCEIGEETIWESQFTSFFYTSEMIPRERIMRNFPKKFSNALKMNNFDTCVGFSFQFSIGEMAFSRTSIIRHSVNRPSGLSDLPH